MLSYRLNPPRVIPPAIVPPEPPAPTYPTMAMVQAAVCDRFHLKPLDMHSERRSRSIARPRQIAMYLCRELTLRSLPEIGRRFGNRDHTTVLHACRRIEALRSKDPDIEAAVRELTEELSNPAREGVALNEGA